MDLRNPLQSELHLIMKSMQMICLKIQFSSQNFKKDQLVEIIAVCSDNTKYQQINALYRQK